MLAGKGIFHLNGEKWKSFFLIQSWSQYISILNEPKSNLTPWIARRREGSGKKIAHDPPIKEVQNFFPPGIGTHFCPISCSLNPTKKHDTTHKREKREGCKKEGRMRRKKGWNMEQYYFFLGMNHFQIKWFLLFPKKNYEFR